MMLESSKPVIITICGDPGGAKAIIPVIKKLEEHSYTQIINYAYNEGANLLENLKIGYKNLPEKVNTDFIKKTYQERKPSLLLSATSFNKFNWEKYFIFETRNFNIFSMAILDYWSNYSLRFSNENGSMEYLPDKIAVMDEYARLEMIEQGFPSDGILVTGQPAFDSLQSDREKFTLSKKNDIRSLLNVANETILILFISQPLKILYGRNGEPNSLGFDEEQVLEYLIKALEKISNQKQDIVLLIRPHPREKESDYEKYCSNRIRIEISKDGESRDYLMTANLVVGMNSILLVEACHLGCTVLSIQPALNKADSLVTNKTKESIAVFDVDKILPALEKLLCLENKENIGVQEMTKKIPGNATSAIVNYLYRYLDICFESI